VGTGGERSGEMKGAAERNKGWESGIGEKRESREVRWDGQRGGGEWWGSEGWVGWSEGGE